MIDVNNGTFSLDDDLVIAPGYTFGQFRKTKYYAGQNPERAFWLEETFEFHDHSFKVGLFFRGETIYILSLLCCDKPFNMEEEEKRKIYHDGILESWAIAQSDYPWGRIKSEYDSKSNISSIDVVFNC